jgi:hypothetical protein
MATDYASNWVVLLLVLGGIAVVALLVYRQKSMSARKPAPPPAHIVEAVRTAVPAMPTSPMYIEMTFDRGGPPEHVQVIRAGKPGFIGIESFPDMGKGMPVRYAEVLWRWDMFYIRPMHWQMPIRVHELSCAEFEIPMGQSAPIHHGMILRLEGGWTVMCKIGENKYE